MYSVVKHTILIQTKVEIYLTVALLASWEMNNLKQSIKLKVKSD